MFFGQLPLKRQKETSFDAFSAGLPDGIFSNQKSQFGENLEGLALENVGMFYDLLVYFASI
jgi:hypothetical protein